MVDRKRFFRTLLGSMLDTVQGFANESGVADQMLSFADAGLEWVDVMPLTEVRDEPKLRVNRGRAFYVFRPDPDGSPLALAGVCPADGRFVQWISRQMLFRCETCGSTFGPDGLLLQQHSSPEKESPNGETTRSMPRAADSPKMEARSPQADEPATRAGEEAPAAGRLASTTENGLAAQEADSPLGTANVSNTSRSGLRLRPVPLRSESGRLLAGLSDAARPSGHPS